MTATLPHTPSHSVDFATAICPMPNCERASATQVRYRATSGSVADSDATSHTAMDVEDGEFVITVVRGEDLLACDIKTSDPYVKV